MILHLHIPKNGGTTTQLIFRRQYPSHESYFIPMEAGVPAIDLELIKEQQKNLKLISGHFSYGIHDSLNVPYKYVTLLRNPVHRIISFYKYALKYKQEFINKGYRLDSLSDFVQHSASGDIHNAQCRLIAGFNGDPKQMQSAALRNLETDFLFVGILERFEESMILMKQRLGWTNHLCYSKQNATQSIDEDIDDNTMSVLYERNAEDFMLYATVEERLLNQISINKLYIKANKILLNSVNPAWALLHKSRNL